MDHLADAPPPIDAAAATALARQCHLTNFSTDPSGLARLARMAKVIATNPTIVNPKLPTAAQAAYYQVVHDHVEAFALSLEDLKVPANVRPFHIRTFGPPAARPPIRAAPAHAAFIRNEVQDLRAAGLVRTEATPWSAPCFAVPKPRSEKLRLVTDYRPLNA